MSETFEQWAERIHFNLDGIGASAARAAWDAGRKAKANELLEGIMAETEPQSPQKPQLS